MTEDDRHHEDEASGESDWRSKIPATRRRVLSATAAGVGVAGMGTLAAQENGPMDIRLGGEVEGWTVLEGSQSDVVGEGPNPTLNLTAGETYTLFWRNVDGLQHNVAILDDEGDVVDDYRTEVISGQGGTQTLEFTASEEMAEYYCEVHPNTMRGDIQIGEGGAGAASEDSQQQAAFFDAGPEVGVQSVAQGMTAPTDFAQPQGGDNFYVTDQTGEVWVVTDEGRQEEPFIDVSDRMLELGQFWGSYADQGQDYDERGLLGISFHPDYQENQRFYLHYSAPPNENTPDGWDHVEVVSEFEASDDGESADPDSERTLLQIQSPQYNHDSGPMAFGPDGYLYVPMGDGGGANDDMYGHVEDWYDENEGGNGQDVTENLLGDVLRIDVDSEGDDEPYGIPEDNPFAGEDNDGMDEIYAYGFRNPFGIDFDSEGNMFVADAGQNLFEEANIVERGGNYGWNVKEGTHCFSTENASDPAAITDCPDSEPDESPYDGSELVDPIVEYPHTYQGANVGIVIAGGHRYENDTIPQLQGAYIYGEWTRDPARQEPQGRVLLARPPEDQMAAGAGDTGDQGIAANQTAGNQTDVEAEGEEALGPENATADEENATAEQVNATGRDVEAEGEEVLGQENATANGTDSQAGLAQGGNQTGNETTGNRTALEGGQSQSEEEQVVPRDDLWEMAEVQIADTEFDYFVRQFGQDQDGEIYVLVSRRGVPEGDTGEVLRLVPAGQGQTDAETETGAETPDAGAGNETGTETPETDAGNETQQSDNETAD